MELGSRVLFLILPLPEMLDLENLLVLLDLGFAICKVRRLNEVSEFQTLFDCTPD